MIKAMKQALEALEKSLPRLAPYGEQDWLDSKAAITSLRQAIAELESHQPVAWRTFDGEGQYEYRAYEENESYADDWDKRNPNHKGWVDPLYTHPPQRTWVGLDEEEVIDLWPDLIMHRHTYQFWQNLEAKLKQKNGYDDEKNT